MCNCIKFFLIINFYGLVLYEDIVKKFNSDLIHKLENMVLSQYLSLWVPDEDF